MNIKGLFNLISSLAFGALLATSSPLPAQTLTTATATAPQPVFDVVAIHENKSSSTGSSSGLRSGSFIATNATVRMILSSAYGIRQELISGLPGWASSTRFDINAKISDPDVDALKKLSPEQRRAMAVALLNDRFFLRAHIEPRILPIYNLVIAKGGSQLKENAGIASKDVAPGTASSGHRNGSFTISNSGMTAVGISLPMLVANLPFFVQRNVIDKTGLTSNYDFTLKFRPAETRPGATSNATDENAPDLFTALQEQLGLKLEPSKGPVDTLVVDHVEMPTEN